MGVGTVEVGMVEVSSVGVGTVEVGSVGVGSVGGIDAVRVGGGTDRGDGAIGGKIAASRLGKENPIEE